MARPTKYCPETATRIVEALSAGNTRRAAAAAAGISEDSLERWLGRFAGFADAIKKAEAQAEVAHVANITAAAQDGSWQASAWWLERRRHAEWAKIDRVEIEVRQAAERIAGQTGADPDWLLRRAAEIVAADMERPSDARRGSIVRESRAPS